MRVRVRVRMRVRVRVSVKVMLADGLEEERIVMAGRGEGPGGGR